MAIGNDLVAAVLRSPLHGILSGSVALVRYTGRRSGRTIVTPVQYVTIGEDVVIVSARPETKTWWRNFTREGDIEVLVRGTWRPLRARAVSGAEEPGTVQPLLEQYLHRFPRAAEALPGDTPEARTAAALVVWCRPRLS